MSYLLHLTQHSRQQRGLARARGTHNSNQLASRHSQVHIGQGRNAFTLSIPREVAKQNQCSLPCSAVEQNFGFVNVTLD